MAKQLIVVAAVLLLLLGFSGRSTAGIHIDVNVPLPPAFVFSAPPELVVIPGTYVYYCPDADFSIFFYDGYWFRPYGGYWYRSVNYGGPWDYIQSPPSVLVSLPPNYRFITRGERRIPYGELHRNWRAWQGGRYWDHHNWGRTEHETHHGLAPSFRERGYGRYHGATPRSRERGYAGYRGGVHSRGGFHGGGGGVRRGGGHQGRERH
jgi:hypothetical protein